MQFEDCGGSTAGSVAAEAYEAIVGVVDPSKRDEAEAALLWLVKQVRELNTSGLAMDKVAKRAHWTYSMANDYFPALYEVHQECADEWLWLDEAEDEYNARLAAEEWIEANE